MEKKEYMKKWREKNKEKIKEYIQKYKQENREHVLAVQRILNHKNYYAGKTQPKKKESGFHIMKGVLIQF